MSSENKSPKRLPAGPGEIKVLEVPGIAVAIHTRDGHNVILEADAGFEIARRIVESRGYVVFPGGSKNTLVQ